MKPFNLEEVKRGEPFVTREGTPARLIAYVPDLVDGERLIVRINDVRRVIPFYDDGSYNEDGPDSWDLFMVSKPSYISVWRKDGVLEVLETDKPIDSHSNDSLFPWLILNHPVE